MPNPTMQQNEADPVSPDDSTADMGGDGSGDDTASAGMDAGNMLNLGPDAAKSVGIMDPQPGDRYHVTIAIGDTSNGITATVEDGSAQKLATEPNDMDDTASAGQDESSDDEADSAGDAKVSELAVKPKKKGQQIMGPQSLGINDIGAMP